MSVELDAFYGRGRDRGTSHQTPHPGLYVAQTAFQRRRNSAFSVSSRPANGAPSVLLYNTPPVIQLRRKGNRFCLVVNDHQARGAAARINLQTQMCLRGIDNGILKNDRRWVPAIHRDFALFKQYTSPCRNGCKGFLSVPGAKALGKTLSLNSSKARVFANAFERFLQATLPVGLIRAVQSPVAEPEVEEALQGAYVIRS